MARKARWLKQQARKLSPTKFISGILLALSQSEASLRLWASAIGLHSDHTISKQALWERIGPEAVGFFKGVLASLLASQGVGANSIPAIPCVLRILIHDFMLITLNEKVGALFTATSNQHGHFGAGLRLQAVMDLISGGALDMSLHPYGRNDQSEAAESGVPQIQPSSVCGNRLFGFWLEPHSNSTLPERRSPPLPCRRTFASGRHRPSHRRSQSSLGSGRSRMIFIRGLRVCLTVEPADGRRCFEGLEVLVRESLREDERSSRLFVFTNRRRDRIRVLYWDGTGNWIMTNRLEAGTLSWPKIPDGAAKLRLRPEARGMLFARIDLHGAGLLPWYEDPAAGGTDAVS